MDAGTVLSDMQLLHPEFRRVAVALYDDLIRGYEMGLTETKFEPFETLRTGLRQQRLLREKTTKAPEWEGAHQFGLAIDFVPKLTSYGAHEFNMRHNLVGLDAVKAGWSWHAEHDYLFLKKMGEARGLKMPVFSWDKCHVEHPNFPAIRRGFNAYLPIK